MKPFGAVRALLFPIYTHEIKKFLPMGLMMLCMLFIYNILRDTKDTLVVNAAGAEALSLLKLLGTVPAAVCILIAYSKLSNIFSREQVFYLTVAPFILFFALFAFVIYPNRELLHPAQETVQYYSAEFPRLRTLFAVMGSWSYGLFYVLSELWGSVVLTLLFWQFANDTVAMTEAKRFYSLFGVVGNLGLVGAGLAIQYFSNVRGLLPAGIDPWGYSLNYLMGAVVFAGIILMAIYRWVNTNVLTDPRYYDPSLIKPKKEKTKLSMKESFFYLIRSKHLGFIALLMLCYGISMNVVEGVWKDQIRAVYGNENSYNTFMGKLTLTQGLASIAFMLMGNSIVRLFGWNIGAKLTPIMVLVTGIPFFLFVVCKDGLNDFTTLYFGLAPAACAVWIGFGQNILSKATKYSLFDPTKEMCYIPLDQESKVKGKAAVDVVGGRLGKSGGAFLQQFFLLLTGSTLSGIAPYLGVMLLFAVALWLVATSCLNKSLQTLEGKKEELQPVLA